MLLTGVAGSDEFLVNDPFYNVSTYVYGDIHDIIMYNVLPVPLAVNVPKSYPLYKQCNEVRRVHACFSSCHSDMYRAGATTSWSRPRPSATSGA